MNSQPVFVGVDVGSSSTKVVVLDSDKNIIGSCVKKSGIDFTKTANISLEISLKMAKAEEKKYRKNYINWLWKKECIICTRDIN